MVRSGKVEPYEFVKRYKFDAHLVMDAVERLYEKDAIYLKSNGEFILSDLGKRYAKKAIKGFIEFNPNWLVTPNEFLGKKIGRTDIYIPKGFVNDRC